jgi:hypothetical protein
VLKAGNSLKWHKEVFLWLDEWVGEESKAAAVDSQAAVVDDAAFVLQG